MKKKDIEIRNNFGFLLGRTSRGFLKMIQDVFDEKGHNVTPVQFAILVALWQVNGQSQQLIADNLEKDKTTLTRVLNGMEKRGLIVRESDDNDKRLKKIHLTVKGKKFENTLMRLTMDKMVISLKGVSSEQLKSCNKVMEAVCSNIYD